MKITLLDENAILLEDSAGMMTIESPDSSTEYSPFHMLGSSLASCMFSLLHSWASQAKLDASRLRVRVRWSFAEDPHRIGSMNVAIEWPGLPEARRVAAERAASLCTVHRTLHQPPQVTIETKAPGA